MSGDIEHCRSIFEILEDTLEKTVKIEWDAKGKVKSIEIRKRDRVQWPFKEQGFGVLRSELDRAKAGLSLQIQVMNYARTQHKEKIEDWYGLAW